MRGVCVPKLAEVWGKSAISEVDGYPRGGYGPRLSAA